MSGMSWRPPGAVRSLRPATGLRQQETAHVADIGTQKPERIAAMLNYITKEKVQQA